jgi:hypothetical protein
MHEVWFVLYSTVGIGAYGIGRLYGERTRENMIMKFTVV